MTDFYEKRIGDFHFRLTSDASPMRSPNKLTIAYQHTEFDRLTLDKLCDLRYGVSRAIEAMTEAK